MEPIKHRITEDEITVLLPGQVFGFGSNEIGKHTKGAARTALKYFGAIMGQAYGLQGRSFGIPTKGKSMNKILTLQQIGAYVDKFVEFAKEHPELTFLMTKIGCGLAHYDAKDIAPLFKNATEVDNIHLPASFWRKIK